MEARAFKTYTKLLAAALAAVGYVNLAQADAQLIERGRYMAIAGACNDCHTPDYMETEGNVPDRAGCACGFVLGLGAGRRSASGGGGGGSTRVDGK